MHLAAHEQERQREVVGEPVAAQLGEHLELGGGGVVDAATQLAAGGGDDVARAAQELGRAEDGVGRLLDFDVGDAAPPGEAAADDARVQRAHERGDARHADAAGGELGGEAGQHLGRARCAGRAVDEPVADGADVDHLPQ